jgi:hypothetical protein
VTASERFALILLAITVGVGLLGWLIRSLWSTQTAATRDNTAALVRLTDVVGRLDSRISTMEGRLEGRGKR